MKTSPTASSVDENQADTLEFLMKNFNKEEMLLILMKNINKEEMLLKAIYEENTGVAQSFIKYGAHVNAKLSNGSTFLIAAILNGKSALAKSLIDAGANVNARDDEGNSALHYAAMFVSDDFLIKELINKGANVHALNHLGKTPLELIGRLIGRFSSNPAYDAIKTFIEHGAKIEERTLFQAILSNRITIVEAFLAHGVNVNAVNTQGATPLIAAIQGGYISIIKCLLRHGADVLAKTADGKTALALAMESGKLDIINFLALQGTQGKNRYTEAQHPIDSNMRTRLYKKRWQDLKDNASYYLASGLLNEKKVDLSNEQLEENKSFITGMKILADLPDELKTDVLFHVHQGKALTYSLYEDKQAKKTANTINAALETRNKMKI